MRHSSRQALEQVVDRARRLAGSALGKDPLDLDVRWTPPGPPTVVGANQLSLDAALRLVRQFLQPSESISFTALAERLPDDPDLSAPFQRDLEKVVRELRVGLDEPPVMRIKIRGKIPHPPTHRELLEAFLHGSIDQLDPTRRETLASWLTHPTSALLVRSQLQIGLGSVCKSIQRLRALCERELLRAAS